MRYIVDRIEDNQAICEGETGKYVTFMLDQFEFEVKEGDCLNETEDGFEKDEEFQQSREEEVESLVDELFE